MLEILNSLEKPDMRRLQGRTKNPSILLSSGTIRMAHHQPRVASCMSALENKWSVCEFNLLTKYLLSTGSDLGPGGEEVASVGPSDCPEVTFFTLG